MLARRITEVKQENDMTPTTRLIPASKWNEYHAWPPRGGLRHLIFHERTNGFHKVVRRCGRRVLIDEAAFFEWARTNGGQNGSPTGANS